MPKKITIVGQDGPEIIKIKKGGVVLDNDKTKFFNGDPLAMAHLRRLADQHHGEELFMKASNHYRAEVGGGGEPMLRMGEFHFGRHNFLGPGTRLDKQGLKRKPFNQVDSIAREHDLMPRSSNNSRMLLNKLKKIKSSTNGYHVMREMLERDVK